MTTASLVVTIAPPVSTTPQAERSPSNPRPLSSKLGISTFNHGTSSLEPVLPRTEGRSLHFPQKSP
ncbi:MAG: hypothetical protein KME15_18440 [Drouetiella hepatica Uher 2000/2452]|uniref:Uncharacterized protein n=1 Tax=Drouetiella hepatica Uher 2000/2452 TaxID=904376 RepID=A0A951QD98_9CYAN|nr:hypothetical protein [Drouetiella hepatica Uher 2000/2452]